MSLFDEIKSQVDTALGGNASPFAVAVGKMLTNQETGGLEGLVDVFRGKGLGQIMDSWVSIGKNLSITPDQIMHALGDQRVQQLASAAGIDVQSASAKLAEILPQIIDKATPDGKVPAGDLIEKGLAFLSSFKV